MKNLILPLVIFVLLFVNCSKDNELISTITGVEAFTDQSEYAPGNQITYHIVSHDEAIKVDWWCQFPYTIEQQADKEWPAVPAGVSAAHMQIKKSHNFLSL